MRYLVSLERTIETDVIIDAPDLKTARKMAEGLTIGPPMPDEANVADWTRVLAVKSASDPVLPRSRRR